MPCQAILFDLDGTLLPMDNDEFTKGYLSLLAKTVAPHGYTADTLLPAMWKGVAAMVKNDGSRFNAEAFWATFASILGEHVHRDIPHFDAFYSNEFSQAEQFTSPTPLAKQAVTLARQKADRVVLATNPLFPAVAVTERLRWAGLHTEDFDLITHYENSRTCKPNPSYFIDICRTLDIDPAHCLMIGNNVQEDIQAAQAAGLSTFLITDCLLGDSTQVTCPQGTFEELVAFLATL